MNDLNQNITEINDHSAIYNDCKTEAGTFRMILPQLLASTVKNLLILDFALSIAIPTIIIPAVTGLADENNSYETIHLTAVEASWLASIAYIFQPLGNIFSGWITEPLGRKRAMILVNIPHIVAWSLLYNSSTKHEIFIVYVLFGIGNGLMGAPMNSYSGEICQPSVRGVLMATSGFASTLGLFMIFLFGNLMLWRNIALTCLIIPIVTIIGLCFVPETPIWLLSQNREDEAKKSLQWLRGWVSPKSIENEFNLLKRYKDFMNNCSKCNESNRKCTHALLTIRQRFTELLQSKTIKPFILLLISFFVSEFSGNAAMRPYFVQIIKAYGIPMSPEKATIIIGLTGVVASIISVSAVKLIGKRCLFLGSLVGVSVSYIALGGYAYIYLPSNRFSFNNNTAIEILSESSAFPLIMFILITLFTNIGVATVPWMLLSELFPLKSRTLAVGLTAASNDIMTFIATKTYFSLERMLKLSGVAWLYAFICCIGIFALYVLLPETENRTLQEIEMHFSNNLRKWTDRNIQHITDKTFADVFNKFSVNSNVIEIVQLGKSTVSALSNIASSSQQLVENYQNILKNLDEAER